MPHVLTMRSHVCAPFRVRSDAGTRSRGLGPELGSGRGRGVGKRPATPRDPQRLGPSSQSGAWPRVSLCPLHARRRTWNPLGCRVAAARGSQRPWKAGAQLDDALPGPSSHERSGLWDLLQPLTGRVAPSKLPDSSLCLTLRISQAYAHG